LAPSRTMNPVLPERVIARAKLKDAERANAEFESIWRQDVSDFVPRDIVELATDRGVLERAPMAGVEYFGFADPAGGSGKDAFALAIGHRGPGNMVIIDCLRERAPRFVPAAVVKEYSDLLKLYRISKIKSDRYASAWASDEWARNHPMRAEHAEQERNLFGCAAGAHERTSAAARQRKASRPADGP
jgi:hypothetical protein